MPEFINFPRQKLPFSQKTKKWRKSVMDWADSKTFFNFSLVQKSVIHKKVNYERLLTQNMSVFKSTITELKRLEFRHERSIISEKDYLKEN